MQTDRQRPPGPHPRYPGLALACLLLVLQLRIANRRMAPVTRPVGRFESWSREGAEVYPRAPRVRLVRQLAPPIHRFPNGPEYRYRPRSWHVSGQDRQWIDVEMEVAHDPTVDLRLGSSTTW